VWRVLHRTAGRVRVGDLARDVGWSARHLGTVLRRETGLGPKTAARVVRFDRARRSVAARRGQDLAGVAVDCGYADQSHLDRDFRAFTGLPPSRWWAEEFRNVQAPPDGEPPGWGHDRHDT
jgi:transcriptional regulator GlxA family with amidase domain